MVRGRGRKWAGCGRSRGHEEHENQETNTNPPPPPPTGIDMAQLAQLITTIVEQVFAQREANNPPLHTVGGVDHAEEIRRLH